MTSASSTLSKDETEKLERLKWNTPLYSRSCVKIIDKKRQVVPLEPNPGQAALDVVLEGQREAGKPMRAIVLKARQIGFSTWVQAKLIQRTTLHSHRAALVVAHDKETAGKLFEIGQFMYSQLPDIDVIKPGTRYFGRARYIKFGQPGAEAWKRGQVFPDSTYNVDTANEVQAGRGATYDFMHLSELAFWGDPITKLTSLLQAVPDTPESLVVVESTANGFNSFKDEWDRAVAGESDFAPFFWAWWQEPSYTLPFSSEAERKEFMESLNSAEELALLDPGPRVWPGGEHVPLTLEQLHWRRRTLNTRCMGRIEVFHQEYPTTPEEAFLATGRQVFDTECVQRALNDCKPGIRHSVKARTYREVADRTGSKIEVPEGPLLEKVEGLVMDPTWELWLPGNGKLESQYLIAADVSGGLVAEGGTDPDYHTAQIIDHRERSQVGEYRSRIDPDLFAQQLYLIAKHFREAWVVIEVTGGWGMPVVRRLYFDYHYPFVYIRRSHESRHDRTDDRLGWSTDRRSKPLMEANGEEMIREGSHGIRSGALCRELLSYVKDDKGRTGAEPGKHDDLAIAWLIAQQAANELPVKPERSRERPKPTTRYKYS